MLGGEFTSRLNMNLREDKHWAYGAYSIVAGRARPAAVDGVRAGADRQDRRVAEGDASRDQRVRRRQVRRRGDELVKIQATEIRSLPGAYETAGAVDRATIGGIVRYGRPDDYVVKRKAEIEAMTPAQVAEAAKAIDPTAADLGRGR